MEQQRSTFIKNVITITAGITSGIVSKFVEYPFDTVKVKLQTQGTNNLPVMYNGTVDCFRKIYLNEGFAGYFRGVAAPVFGACLELGLTFWSYEFALDMLKYYYISTGSTRINAFVDEGTKLNKAEILYAGAVAGMFTPLLLCPIELLKCKMQVQANVMESVSTGLLKSEKGVVYRSISHCLLATVKHEGILGMFRGYVPTIGREVPGNMLWFFNYEMSKRYLKDKVQSDLMISMLSGASAGIGYWTVGMPFDRIKSVLQTETVNKQKILPMIKKIAQTEGIRGFYKGYLPTVIRSMPSNAAIFSVYEITVKLLNSLTNN